MRQQRRPVIFVRGITPRSGTNYLRDLLVLHPDCSKARSPVWEDFALDDSDLLIRFTRRLATRWPAAWGVPVQEVGAELLRSFGDALVASLIASPEADASGGIPPRSVLVAKTPSVNGLVQFPALFPDDHLVVLVRDGRDVVESLHRSFGWSFDRATRAWASGARSILDYRAAHAETLGGRWLLVRYEDVLAAPIDWAGRIHTLAGLDPTRLEQQAVHDMPVRGSSTFGKGDRGVHWRPTARDESFSPVRRWGSWTNDQHARFNWVAGGAMQALGYSLEETDSRRSKLTHRLLDSRAVAEEAARGSRRRLRELRSGSPIQPG